MKTSYRWLSDWLKPPTLDTALLDRFTMAGLEVVAMSPTFDFDKSKLHGVSGAKVLEAVPHPNADRLSLCTLQTRNGRVRVVCGAPDLSVGGVYAYAPPKSVLPNMSIEKREVRGEVSEGMLCAGQELGLGDYYGNGLLRLPESFSLGEDLYQTLELDDSVIEFDLTPNRGDCLSAFGIACELASLYEKPFPKIKPKSITPTCDTGVKIKLSTPDDCPRYMACAIEGIDLGTVTPPYIADRLRRCGTNAVNVVVDICNYVMLDLGQPLHAFDLDKLEGDIEVRRARDGESLKLLDGSEATLSERDLLIADSKKPVAMAGLMGGANSGVFNSTENILLESAWFNPRALAGRARVHGVHSDAAHRYERGVDPSLAELALRHCVALLLRVAGGKSGPICSALSKRHLPESPTITVNYSCVRDLLGLSLTKAETASLLKRIGGQMRSTRIGWELTPPSRRRDLVIEEDIMEEIARLHGYERIPVEMPQSTIQFGRMPKHMLGKEVAADRLIAMGYQEVANYSLVPQDAKSPLAGVVGLANWVSKDMSALRGSLLPGLVQNMSHYERRQIHDLRLFEIGVCFEDNLSANKNGGRPLEHQRLAMLLGGRRNPESWSGSADTVDIYDLKAEVGALLSLSGRIWDLSRPNTELKPGLIDPSCCIAIPELSGIMGRLDPHWVSHWGLRSAPMLMELDLNLLQSQSLDYQPLSREHPVLKRDLAIVVKDSIAQARISNCIEEAAKKSLNSHTGGSVATLESLVLFDVYQGNKVASQHRSMAYHLEFRHSDRAMKDLEVDAVCADIVKALGEEYGAILRDN
jgi:phenylalanyl-tRNA synthetase beta chain